MHILPAIDLYDGKVVRLKRGDYAEMTVYGDDPLSIARGFAECGAEYLHVVDLEGAKNGEIPNFRTIKDLAANSGLKVEVGGGIRSRDTAERYLDTGVERIILGTAAVTDPELRCELVGVYGSRIAVGVDIRDGFVAIKGWLELSKKSCEEFCGELEADGVRTVICTDVSRDGLLAGANLELYRRLAGLFKLDIIASGGVSTLDDLRALQGIGLYGAIVGKALYEGGFDLAEGIRIARGQ